MIRRDWREGRQVDPHEIAGFFFERAFEEDARLVGRPAKDAEADANAGYAIGRSEIANLEDFLVQEIRDFLAAGGDADAALVAVQRGQLFGFVTAHVELLEAGRAGEVVILFDGDGGVRSRQPGDVTEGAAFVK